MYISKPISRRNHPFLLLKRRLNNNATRSGVVVRAGRFLSLPHRRLAHQQHTEEWPPIDRFGIVAAVSTNGVIGVDGGIPWHVPEDRNLFKSLTDRGILIMGRRTFEECSSLAHLNHSNTCIVVSRSLEKLHFDPNDAPNTALELTPTFPAALALARIISANTQTQTQTQLHEDQGVKLRCWVVGGQRLYEEALKHSSAAEVHLSVIDFKSESSGGEREIALFPDKRHWGVAFEEKSSSLYSATEDAPGFVYTIYQRKDHDDA